VIPGLVIAVVIAVVAGVLRSGAVALVRTPRADALRDASEHRAGAARVASILDRRDQIVPSVNVTHGTLLTAAAIVGTWALARFVSGGALAVALVAAGLVLIVVADLMPRALGRRRPRALAYRLAPMLAAAVALGSWATDLMVDEPGGQDSDDDEDDDEDETQLITSVLEFSETIVREVMVPRTDMVTVSGTASFSELLVLFDEHGFSRVPVVGDGPDDVIGLIIIKDLLPVFSSGKRPDNVAAVMRPIDFVPETKRVPELLREMQASKSHMAVVVDEYGGTAGIVTIEDLLEELVGEIVDEYDDEELLIEERGEGRWAVDGRLAVEELSDLVGTELPDEEWDTVAGLVLGLAGRVPQESECFEVGDVALTVVRVQGRRVALVEVERLRRSRLAEEAQ
jgi:CBS domain containing-hemolysin-like protein